MIPPIQVTTKSHEIETSLNSIECYFSMKNKFKEDELFILESLSGPAKDCTRSVIGYHPVLSLAWSPGRLQFYGNQNIIDVLLSNPMWSQNIKLHNSIQFSPGKRAFDVLKEIESIFSVDHLENSNGFGFGFFGYIGYDAVFAIESITKKIDRSTAEDEIFLSLYEGIINIDLVGNTVTLVTNSCPLWDAIDHEEISSLLKKEVIIPELVVPDSSSCVCYPSLDQNTYHSFVEKAKYHISIGDIYQIQIGHNILIKSDVEPLDVYRRLRHYNPSPYMYYFCAGNGIKIVGASPEMFVVLDQNRQVQMRPIAGTARKSSTKSENDVIGKKLLADEKERAEHLMLVDLCRNDIARVSVPEALTVDELMVLEEYSHVIHIVSNVSGKLIENKDKYDLISASFPAGTMTGTPKIRAIEIIEDTELSSRGVYAGCVGFFGFDNTVASALCIRTATWSNGQYSIRASGGIVEDSTPQNEWKETISKLSSTYFAITNRELADEDFTR